MNDTNIRLSTRLFTNVTRFPYGFKKSGDFSISESIILSVHGQILQSLELGTLEPVSVEEEHFIQVCKGLVNPETTVERAWLKYTLLSNTKKHFFTLHSSHFNIAVANEETEEYDNSDIEIPA